MHRSVDVVVFSPSWMSSEYRWFFLSCWGLANISHQLGWSRCRHRCWCEECWLTCKILWHHVNTFRSELSCFNLLLQVHWRTSFLKLQRQFIDQNKWLKNVPRTTTTTCFRTWSVKTQNRGIWFKSPITAVLSLGVFGRFGSEDWAFGFSELDPIRSPWSEFIRDGK